MKNPKETVMNSQKLRQLLPSQALRALAPAPLTRANTSHADSALTLGNRQVTFLSLWALVHQEPLCWWICAVMLGPMSDCGIPHPVLVPLVWLLHQTLAACPVVGPTPQLTRAEQDNKAPEVSTASQSEGEVDAPSVGWGEMQSEPNLTRG